MADVKVSIPRNDYNPNQRTDIDVEVVNPDGSLSTRTVKGAVQSTTQEDGTVTFGILASAHVPFAAAASYESAVLNLSPWALWMHDDASGNLADSSGNSRTATAFGTLSYQQSGPGVGGVDDAIEYAASGSGIYAAPGVAATWSTVTICALVYIPTGDTDAFQHVILGFANSYGSTTYDKTLTLNASDQPSWYVFDGNVRRITSSSALTRGQWYHLAAVVGPNEKFRLYVNGAEVASNTGVTTSFAGSTMYPFIRGGGIEDRASRAIRLAGVALWNDELTLSEITSMAEAAGL